MTLSPQTLERLRIILKKNFGQELNDRELSDCAYNLVSLFDLLTRLYYEDYMVGSNTKNNNGKEISG